MMTATPAFATVSTMPMVLVVEDEMALAQAIELYLRRDNYRTERAGDGLRALELFRAAQPDLVILDLGLPKLDGLEVLKTIRKDSDVPVIILTARAEEVDELLALGLGADNYLAKPISPRKLMAHVKAMLRRKNTIQSAQNYLYFGDVEIDTYGMLVKVNEKPLNLTPTEYRLLYHLALTPERAISRGELYEVAMPESDAYERAVDIHMTNLRRKLREEGVDKLIDTVRGVGYRLMPPHD